MSNRLHPFETVSGSDKLGRPLFLLLLLTISVLAAFMIAKMGIIGGLLLIMLPFVVVYMNFLFRSPIVGLYTAIGLGFLAGFGKIYWRCSHRPRHGWNFNIYIYCINFQQILRKSGLVKGQ